MDESGLLLAGIEVSIALAGFAGIVATFQNQDGATARRGDAVGLTIIVNFSLMGAFLLRSSSRSSRLSSRGGHDMVNQ